MGDTRTKIERVVAQITGESVNDMVCKTTKTEVPVCPESRLRRYSEYPSRDTLELLRVFKPKPKKQLQDDAMAARAMSNVMGDTRTKRERVVAQITGERVNDMVCKTEEKIRERKAGTEACTKTEVPVCPESRL